MNKNINLDLTPNEVQIIGEALLELPAKKTMHVINNMNMQITAQMKPEQHKDGEIKEKSNEE